MGTQLSAHKEQLFTGVRIHKCQIGPQVGKPLPIVTGHTGQNSALTMNDFIVGQGQNKIFTPGINRTERHLPMMVLAIDRIEFHILKRVVHPSHVPFEVKPKPAVCNRRGHTRPAG